ncbi:histidine phosphatase family protein [Breoghania sp.]|uniref:histidine phosphatase family protein n=1 Tax=Breoghania sp. TaxID=2065378 RepID=UPI00261B8774|nr:histidine phosphatase family protein [Breoghania sp.]MDJ0932377.1 histidine phosphatase family protein [Breoghania sp.]
MTATMIFIRHGETPWNLEGRLQGQREVDISEVGRAQARRNGRTVKAYFESLGRDPESFAYLASPMARTRETMWLVREEIDLVPEAFTCNEALKELTFGEWEGFTMAELKERDRESVRQRRADKWGFTPPGGKSYAALSHRVVGWLETVTGDAVVVAHDGILRVLRGLLFSAPASCLPIRSIDQDRVLVTHGRLGTWL